MNRLSVEAFRAAGKVPLRVVLDNVRSLHNVGAMFRTADAFRLEGLVLCGITGTPAPNTQNALATGTQGFPQQSRTAIEELHKTALGAEETVSWTYYADTLQAVRDLQAQGYTVFAIEQAHGSTMLGDLRLDPNGRYAIVMGHEVFGVQQEVVDCCNGCIEIPQYGTKHSLNVSVAAGIVMYTISNLLITPNQ